MKKSIVKFLAALLALALVISATPAVVFAAEATHSHTFIETDGGYGFEPYSNTHHRYVHYTNYDCACGADSYRVAVVISEAAHSAMPGSQEYLGTYLGDNGYAVSTYRYTCKVCGDTYTRSVVE